jgi:hypothetical protein
VQVRGHAVGGLVGVEQLPVLGWVAPVEEGVVVLEGGAVVKVEELAAAAVEILLPRISIHKKEVEKQHIRRNHYYYQ